MTWLLAAMGIALVVMILVDVVWTTLSLRHAGPLTRLSSRWVWAIWFQAVPSGKF